MVQNVKYLLFKIQENVPEPAKSSSSSSASSSSSSDSSSSCSSSSSSSEDDDDGDTNEHVKQASAPVRTRDLHPVPQQKAQIVMAKQEPAKKRSRKPPLLLPPPEARDFQQNRGGPRKVPKAARDGGDLPGAIKKPVHPASFTFMGFQRGSARDPGGGGPPKGPASPAGPGRPPVQTASSLPPNRSGQSRNSAEGKLSGLDLKTAAGKSKGVAALSLNTSKHPVQGTTQHTLSPPGGQKKAPPPPAAPQQRVLGAKTAAAPPPKGSAPSSQSPGAQPLNLQNKLSQSSDAAGTRTPAPQRGPGPGQRAPGPGQRPNPPNPARKTQSREGDPPKSPAAPGRPAARKAPGEKASEIQTARVQGRLDKSCAEIQNQNQPERSASKGGKKAKMTDMSTGEEESSSDSDQDDSYASASAQNQDWKPTRSLIEHVFVTDVTANLVTVTVKESPTSVGFFSIRNY